MKKSKTDFFKRQAQGARSASLCTGQPAANLRPRGLPAAHPAGAQQAVPAKMPRGKTPGHFQAQQK